MSTEDFSRKLGALNGDLVRRIERLISKFSGVPKAWNLEGEWENRQISEPNITRYNNQGHYRLDQPSDPLNPLEPLYPLRRRPMPKRPFETPQSSLREASEPLADVFEDEKAIKIYFEVRGADQKNIQLNVTKGNAQVKTEDFFKTVNLPHNNVDLENTSSRCKNGVLEITIPKKGTSLDKNTVMIKID